MVIIQRQRHLGNENVQIQAMKSKFPWFTAKRKKGEIVFSGNLMVKLELPIYNVSVHYRYRLQPKVFINSPEIDKKCPHKYSDGSLCLYHPKNYKWNADKLVALHVMQWTITWIYFYEAWLETKVWFGPEVPHDNVSSKEIEKEKEDDD